jgi:hypothetical protein
LRLEFSKKSQFLFSLQKKTIEADWRFSWQCEQKTVLCVTVWHAVNEWSHAHSTWNLTVPMLYEIWSVREIWSGDKFTGKYGASLNFLSEHSVRLIIN